jgi:hypothetical protein
MASSQFLLNPVARINKKKGKLLCKDVVANSPKTHYRVREIKINLFFKEKNF